MNNDLSSLANISLPKQFSTLRSFPSASRNCYTLKPVTKGFKYLIRASFRHGNYDGLSNKLSSKSVVFDLHLGVNLWRTINISNASTVYRTEVMTVAEFNFVSVCLVNTNMGTPFISSLELRPLKSTIYPAVNVSRPLILYRRYNVGSKEQVIRYPDDPYDRIWTPIDFDTDWTQISTASKVVDDPDDYFELPSAVLQTAAIPANNTSLQISWSAATEADGTLSQYHFFFHFAEIQSESIGVKKSRTFIVYLNGNDFSGPFTPYYLSAGHIFTILPGKGYWFNVSIEQTKTVPPILNAMEIHSAMRVREIETDSRDVDGIMGVKEYYQVKRNWMGDPCAPRRFSWDGLGCSYMMSTPTRILVLNLSSSKLTGEISSYLGNLRAIQNLDLSHNNLHGRVPDFLAELTSLQVLNLTGNLLSGPIPPALLGRKRNGSLILSVEGNPDMCMDERSCVKKNKSTSIGVILSAVLSVAGVLLLLLVVFFVLRKRRRQQSSALGATVKPQNDGDLGQLMNNNETLQSKSQQFTYREIENITNNFKKEIGKGGFGTVYHGCLENGSQVAVKMHSQSSSQGSTEFMTEAQVLTRIHHRSLVPLVGYCNDENHFALIYEYMPQGNLEDHLRGKSGNTEILNWGERLRIALEAAQGLEYLHNGCNPPIIHRDVKTSNILLNNKLEAMISDFGLSKNFQDSLTHVSTRVVGTVGYVDPEYYRSLQLTEKSDIYSFGVVLLELITGRPAVLPRPEQCHIRQWVQQRLAKGDIADLLDPRLEVAFENSVWNLVDIAMKCTAAASSDRPTMSYVVSQLKEALAVEATQKSIHDWSIPAHDATESNTSEIDHGGSMSILGR